MAWCKQSPSRLSPLFPSPIHPPPLHFPLHSFTTLHHFIPPYTPSLPPTKSHITFHYPLVVFFLSSRDLPNGSPTHSFASLDAGFKLFITLPFLRALHFLPSFLLFFPFTSLYSLHLTILAVPSIFPYSCTAAY